VQKYDGDIVDEPVLVEMKVIIPYTMKRRVIN
jgi:hypothetical protein